MTLDHAIDLAVAETSRAREKHGDSIERYDDYRRSPVLVEEVGEVADVLNELSLGNLTRDQATERLIAELTQVASVALRWTAALLAGDAPPGFKRCKTPGCSVMLVDDSPRDTCPVCSDRNFKEHQARYIKEMSAMTSTGDTAAVICATDGCGAIMRDSKHDRCSTCRGAGSPMTHPLDERIACATDGCSFTVRDMTSKYCPPCRSARSGHGL